MRSIEMQLFGGVVDVVQVVFDGKAHNTTVTLHDPYWQEHALSLVILS